MKLTPVLCAAAAALVFVTLTPHAAAQTEQTFEVGVGFSYPLRSEELYADQAIGLRGRFGFDLSPKWTLLAVYEQATGDSDVPNTPQDGDVTITLYGVQFLYRVRGERQLQLLVFGGAGLGSIDFDNPAAPTPGLPNDTDLEAWLELGLGANIGLSERFHLQLALSARQLRPGDPSILISGSELEFVPSADLVFRF